tara:strand:- start:45 stop:704 length:660 start_codon:yes stop_codon:yes gene_type:complete
MYNSVFYKLTFLLTAIFLIKACTPTIQEGKSKEINPADTLKVIRVVPVEKLKKLTNKELINLSLKDTNISSYLKEIYAQKKLVPANDSIMLTIVDSIGTKSKNSLFYFLTFTYSMNGSDGFLSEIIGYTSLDYLKNNTKEFFNYYNTVEELNENHLGQWAEYIANEIYISNSEQIETIDTNIFHQEIDKFKKEIISNLQSENEKYSTLIQKLFFKIKST